MGGTIDGRTTDSESNQVVLNLQSDFGFQLRFAGIDNNCLSPEILENRKTIRNYPRTLLKNYPDVSFCETADGIRFLRIRFDVPTFDSGDRQYDSWHTLYLIQKEHHGFDAVYATGGYQVVSVKGYKGLLEMPDELAELKKFNLP